MQLLKNQKHFAPFLLRFWEKNEPQSLRISEIIDSERSDYVNT